MTISGTDLVETVSHATMRSTQASFNGLKVPSGPYFQLNNFRPVPRYEHRRTAGEIHRCKKGQRTDIKPLGAQKARWTVKNALEDRVDEVRLRPK